MDNLTHTLTGVLLARAGLSRLTPRATALCLLGANIADLDVIVATSGINYLNYHRHLTHSLLAVPVMAALAVTLVELSARWFRPRAGPARWGRAWIVACVAALTHPLLDMANAYGIRPWLPFSSRWQSWDILFVVDPWVWAILLLTTLVPALLRLANREIGARSDPRRSAAWVGLLALIGFMGARAVLHHGAVETINAYLYDGSPALRVAAFPSSFNPFVWSAYIETERYYQIATLDVRETYDPSGGRRFYKAADGPALETAWDSRIGRDYARFARYAYAQVEQFPEGYVVRLADFRFRRGEGFGFLCTIEMDRAYHVVRQVFRF